MHESHLTLHGEQETKQEHQRTPRVNLAREEYGPPTYTHDTPDKKDTRPPPSDLKLKGVPETLHSKLLFVSLFFFLCVFST